MSIKLDQFSTNEIRDELDRRKHLRFMKRCWNDPSTEFIEGYHTRVISERLDRAIEDYSQGVSTFIRVAVHPRSGKSELIAVYLPPRFLALFPDANVMSVSYNKDKAEEASTKAMRMVDMSDFKKLWPAFALGRRTVRNWNFYDMERGYSTQGSIYSAGLTAGLTGRGYSLGVLDDYCSNRKAAESQTQRASMWSAFTDDFMTRRAPVSITIILATQWHSDDIHGRIAKRNDPEHLDYNPEFPDFEFLRFPARRKLAAKSERKFYPGEYLFMERYSEGWYKSMYALLNARGGYAASAMMDCNPILKGGNILAVDKVVLHPTADEFPKDLTFYRVWDFAHSQKQKTSDDPDYTGGTLIACRIIGKVPELNLPIWEFWLKDYVQFQEKAPARDKKIKRIAKDDGPGVRVLVENSLDSKDGADYLHDFLLGIRSVLKVNCPGDKMTRLAPMESIFEAGNMHIVRAAWNRIWLDGCRDFDGTGSTHDEMIDNMTCAYQELCTPSGYEVLNDPYR